MELQKSNINQNKYSTAICTQSESVFTVLLWCVNEL